MPDVPQSPLDILSAAADRATVVGGQLTALEQDLQRYQERRSHASHADGIALLAAAAAAMRELAAAIDNDAEESERGQ